MAPMIDYLTRMTTGNTEHRVQLPRSFVSMFDTGAAADRWRSSRYLRAGDGMDFLDRSMEIHFVQGRMGRRSSDE